MQLARVSLLVAPVVFLLAGCAHRQSAVKINYLPDDAFTVSEATLHEVSQDDGFIPEKYWGVPIRSLKPLRVYEDRVNIAVVTEQHQHEERGVYFYRSISSYAPKDAPGRKFRWNAKTEQLEYVFTK